MFHSLIFAHFSTLIATKKMSDSCKNMLPQAWTNAEEPYIPANQVECEECISTAYPGKEDKEEGKLRTRHIFKSLTLNLNL